MKLFSLAFIFLALVSNLPATAKDAAPKASPAWTYVSAYGGSVPWKVKQGVASVIFDNRSLSVKILNDRNEVVETIEGEVTSTKIAARRRVIFSDVDAEHFSGSYKRLVDGATVYEVITLSNDFGFVGLNRITRKNNLRR